MLRRALPLLFFASQAWTQPVPPAIPAPFAHMQRWAGPDAPALGFTQEKLKDFLQARATDLQAARSEPWSTWLKQLEGSSCPSLRAWALARRVEAGDFAAYAAFQNAVMEHLMGISKPGSGLSGRAIREPPGDLAIKDMPGSLHIDHASPFWASLREAVLGSPDRHVGSNLYAIWCYGTHPDQKDLILEIARQVEAPSTLRNPFHDPWNDPRFWIVVDWTLVWSSREDRAELLAALAKGPARDEFDRVIRAAEKVPNFFRDTPEAPPVPPWPPAADAPGKPSMPPIDFEFSQIRVKNQPRPPRYPYEAHQNKLMTNLVVDITVDSEGKPVACRPLPGPWLAFFAPCGAAYGLSWRFHPATLNGVPVPAQFRLILPFHMKDY